MSKDPVFPKCYVNVGDGAFIEAIPQPKDVIEKLEREIEELHSLLQKTGEHPNRQLTSAPALSAEQIESVRRIFLSHYGFNNETDLQRRGNINDLCDMALYSLTARDEGIEAAAKACESRAGHESMGAYRILTSCADAIRALKGQP